MEGATGSQLTFRGKGKAPGPPPPPPSGDEANGGHRRGWQRRRRGRAMVVALVAMIPSAVFLLLADTPGVLPPSPEWLLLAYFLWIIGLNMMLVWLLNN